MPGHPRVVDDSQRHEPLRSSPRQYLVRGKKEGEASDRDQDWKEKEAHGLRPQQGTYASVQIGQARCWRSGDPARTKPSGRSREYLVGSIRDQHNRARARGRSARAKERSASRVRPHNGPRTHSEDSPRDDEPARARTARRFGRSELSHRKFPVRPEASSLLLAVRIRPWSNLLAVPLTSQSCDAPVALRNLVRLKSHIARKIVFPTLFS